MEVTKKIHDLQSLNQLLDDKLNVGILGGSFNPAHAGHLEISRQALAILNLDYIIWLVALQNPLKPQYQQDIFTRARQAAEIARHPGILVSTLENDIGSGYIYDALLLLKKRFPQVSFTWLMGVDNLKDFHKWYKYEEIPELCKIAILDRPGYSHYFNSSVFSLKFKASIAKKKTGNIMFLKGIKVDASSTNIRKIQDYE